MSDTQPSALQPFSPSALSHPLPSRLRWQPLRSGILNLYRYDREEFHYADGRLFLRGNNGSGKSRVLALQLPFLLDGEVTPARVEPDGDPAKRIEWNLLMGRHPDRTGYTWIEFGRLDNTGAIFQKVDDYRRAVDTALFGLGPRYPALIGLLLSLRRPQLSRKIDENELPATLSDALPTLPASIIDEVAESFRSLQADKETITAFTKARDAVTAFLQEYTTYIRIAIRRRADTLRKTHSAYERAQRAAAAAATAAQTATDTFASLQRRQIENETVLAAAQAAERTLANDPAMRTVADLRAAEDKATDAEHTLATLETDATQAAQNHEQTLARQTRAETQATAIRSDLDAQLSTAARAADAAQLGAEHQKHLPPASSEKLPDATRAQTALAHALAHRQRAIEQLNRLYAALTAARTTLDAAEQKLRDAQAIASLARDTEHTARETLTTRSTEHLAAYITWRATLRRIRPRPRPQRTQDAHRNPPRSHPPPPQTRRPTPPRRSRPRAPRHRRRL
jgi:predicted ABC-type ATPase